MQDVVFKKSFLSLAEQKEVYEQVLQIQPGFYVPVLRNGAQMNLQMNADLPAVRRLRATVNLRD